MHQARKQWFAAVLTSVSGYVDALCSIALYRVFVANMSGNSIDLGMAGVQGNLDVLLRRGFAVPMFVIGLIGSRVAIDAATRRRVRWTAGVLFGTEAVLLTGFAVLGAGTMAGYRIHSGLVRYLALIALPSVAMGLQNATLTHFGPLTIRTTHVTGTLANLAEHLAQFILWFRARTRGRSRRRFRAAVRVSPRQKALRDALLLFVVWLGYVAGAGFGAFGMLYWKLNAIALPVGALLLMVIADIRWPLIAPR